jgi:transcriptional regulator with XRE-family HTH domain
MPDSTSPQRNLRRRTIGLLIRRVREGASCTVAQLAAALQVKPATMKAYEAGIREPSLVELLAISDWLSVSVTALLDEAGPTLPIAPSQLNVQAALQLGNHVLGAKLKQARLNADESLKVLAGAVGISSGMLKSYELGTAIPITVLEALTAHFGLTMQHWFEADAFHINPAQQQQTAFAALPSDVRAFVTNADALSHLRMAMQLHALPANEVQRVAEALLLLNKPLPG